jgi:dienelactone hydrolase
MIEAEVDIETAEGTMKTFIFHPQTSGPFPVVLYLMDAPSIRPVLKDMASRLATAGYYVMLLACSIGARTDFGQSDEDMHARRPWRPSARPTLSATPRRCCSMLTAICCQGRKRGCCGFA